MDTEANQTEENKKFEVEYKEVNNNLRHYGNMRFAQLTIFFALTGGLIGFSFKNNSLNPVIAFCTYVVGILLAVVFWIMEESAIKKWRAFKKRANIIEKKLKYKQLRTSPIMGFFSATNATRLIFFGAIVFWFIIIYTNCVCCKRTC